MKQRITVEQLNELSNDQKETLREWWNPKVGEWCAYDGKERLIIESHEEDVTSTTIVIGFIEDVVDINDAADIYPILSIGQMIEYLSTDLEPEIENPKRMYWQVHLSTRCSDITWLDKEGNTEFNRSTSGHEELCDALWEAVKMVLKDIGTTE